MANEWYFARRQWCDTGLIAPGHICGARALVELISVDRPLVCWEVVGSRAVVLRKTRCGSDQKGWESVPRWSLRIDSTRCSEALRRNSGMQCTGLCTVCLFIAMTHRHEPWFKVLSHQHHSLELEQVEARVVEVAEVTAHAMYFRFSPSLNHQQVTELEAILVNVQADVVGQAGPGGPGGGAWSGGGGGSFGPKGTSESSKEVNFGGGG